MSKHILQWVKIVQDGDKTFQVWSNPDGSTWQIRKPPTRPGDPGYSFGSSINHDYDTNSELVVVENNEYVNNYNNTDLSLDVKNEVFKDLGNDKYQDKGFFTNLAEENTNNDEKPNLPNGDVKDKPEANIYDLQSDLKKLQKTDSILQRLSLRNLKYPIDADYGNTQDYVQIDQFTYQAVSPSIVFPQKLSKEEGAFDAGKRVASDTFFKGLDRGSPKNITIGNVRLPMPNQLNDSNNVAWGEDQLNALTAAAATLGAGGLQQGIDFFDDIRTGKV